MRRSGIYSNELALITQMDSVRWKTFLLPAKVKVVWSLKIDKGRFSNFV